MTFSDIYREERLISRRSRARKARIAGRVIGFGLTVCLVVAMRSDPQLRALVEETALRVIGAGEVAEGNSAQADAIDSLGYMPGSAEAQALDQLGLTGDTSGAAPATSGMPPSRVKINRPTSG